jgi:general secretion pathway protein H
MPRALPSSFPLVVKRPALRCSRGGGFVGRAAERGVTLLEIMIVMIVLAIVTSGMVLGTGQLASARLKQTATMVAGAVRTAFSRATATSKSQRIVLDLDEQKIWLEESSLPMLVQSKDTSPTGGAEVATVAEKTALAESDRIIKGPRAPRPSFRAVQSLGFGDGTGAKGPRAIGRGIKFREVQTLHDDKPRDSGRAYLYFWPGGQTELASIQIRIGDSTDEGDTLTLLVSPLTGKVTVKNGPVALVVPVDDKGASEREDRGGAF